MILEKLLPKAVLFVRNYNQLAIPFVEEDMFSESLNDAFLEMRKELSKLPVRSAIAIQTEYVAMKVAAELLGYSSLTVQYNPSSINISTNLSSNGEKDDKSKDMSTIVNMQTRQNNKSAITTFSTQLIFDAVNNFDAFNVTESVSTGGVLNMAKRGINGECTVKPQVEALIGSLLSPNTRRVIFCWSNMIFRGELKSVDANFTMFNKKGNPIRAVVNITIQQDFDSAKDEKGGYWDMAFTKAFGKADQNMITGEKSLGDKIMNNSVLNINI